MSERQSHSDLEVTMKLQPLAFGIAAGLVWAFGVFFAGIFAMFDWGNAFVTMLGSFYLGYGPTVVGAIIGALWAVVDGFCFGFVIAWIYNRVAK
jgi:hypothetical protein